MKQRSCLQTLLALHHENDAVWALQETGLRRYAKMRGWTFRAVRVSLRVRDVKLVTKAIQEIKPIGVVSSLRMRLPLRTLKGVPIVHLDTTPSVVSPHAPLFRHDADITARLAVRELHANNRRCYAYVGYAPTCDWSRERGERFAKQLADLGEEDVRMLTTGVRLPGTGFDRRLTKWLATLPVPCGLFAANDELAASVLKCARRMGLKVPEELSVVGVDGNEDICLKAVPPLSSVVPDWEAGAYMAAAALDGLMRGVRKSAGLRNVFRPLGLIRRGSSSPSPLRFGPFVLRAFSKIRAHACEGLTVPQVVSEMRCSRRFAERLFREVSGVSILEEIRSVRFAAAKAALLDPDLLLVAVAHRCGWKSVTTFCREFRRETGLTPGAWRRKSLLSGDCVCAQTDN